MYSDHLGQGISRVLEEFHTTIKACPLRSGDPKGSRTGDGFRSPPKRSLSTLGDRKGSWRGDRFRSPPRHSPIDFS